MGFLISNVIRFYDRRMYGPMMLEYFGHSDYHNFGYWTEGIGTQAEASENLVEKLLAFIPERKGTILDVACGMGASTKHLLRHYDPSDVTAINISARQLETARRNAPGCTFLRMDAAKLEFDANTFDNLLCVESAFHFDSREGFLREAFRVLKPGGCLALSDMLLHRRAVRWNLRIPDRNWVADPDAYRALYERTGFSDVEIIDATAECWLSHQENLNRWRRERYRRGRIRPIRYLLAVLWNRLAVASIGNYLLVGARKP